MGMLLCARKFSTAKIGCSFEMVKYTPLGVPFILLLMVPTIDLKRVSTETWKIPAVTARQEQIRISN